MSYAPRHYPINVRTSWMAHSPALRYHTTRRLRSRLAPFGSQIRSVVARISADPRLSGEWRCDVEVITTDPAPVSASVVGSELFTLVDRAVDAVLAALRQRRSADTSEMVEQRIA